MTLYFARIEIGKGKRGSICMKSAGYILKLKYICHENTLEDKSVDNLDLASLFSPLLQVRMAGPKHQKDRVVSGGGGEAVAPGQADANSVENHCPHHWENCCTVLGTL